MEYSNELHNSLRMDSNEIPPNSSIGNFKNQWLICLLDEIDRLQKLHEWIPVSERLPEVKKDTLFLCKFKDAQDNWKIDTKTFWAASGQFSGSCQIVYWMELPK
jgi:hypothetical protein